MPSKFGGIPVESAPASGSRFGGIPVESNALIMPDGSSAVDAGKRLRVAQQEAKRNDPTAGTSYPERALILAGRKFDQLGRGIKGAATAAADIALRANPQIPGGDAVRRSLARQHATEADRRQTDAPLMARGGSSITDAGMTAVGYVGPGVVLRGTGAASTFLPRTIPGNIAQGAAIGLTQPVANEAERGRNVGLGAGLGGAGALIPRTVGGTGRVVKKMGESLTDAGALRGAARAVRDEASDPNALMVSSPSLVPNVRRTLYDETLDPGVARLETKARGRGAGWAEGDSANNAFRVDALRTFAGDDAAIAAAKAARAKVADPLRATANKAAGVDTSRLLSQIKRAETTNAGRPAIQKALGDVRALLTREVPEAERKKSALAAMSEFATKGRKSAADHAAATEAMKMIRRGEVPDVAISSATGQDALKAAQKIMKMESKGSSKTTVFAHGKPIKVIETKGQDKVAVLSNIRLTIGDMLSGKYGGDSGAALAGARSLIAIRNQLDRVTTKYSPEYGQSLDAFRTMSRPVNRLQTGQTLIDRSAGPIPDMSTGGTPSLTAHKFGGQAKDLDATAAAATGFRKAKAANILEPQDFATIAAINDDLARSASRLSRGSGPGSHTASQLEVGKRMAIKALALKVPGLNVALAYLDAQGASRLIGAMDIVLQNPDKYRQVAAQLSRGDAKLLESALSRAGGTVGAMAPALTE